jgi:hypothetical protein
MQVEVVCFEPPTPTTTGKVTFAFKNVTYCDDGRVLMIFAYPTDKNPNGEKIASFSDWSYWRKTGD